MPYSRDKDLNKIISETVKTGARFVHGKKHGKLFFPNGGLMVIPKTPSDVRAIRNVKAELARLRRTKELLA